MSSRAPASENRVKASFMIIAVLFRSTPLPNLREKQLWLTVWPFFCSYLLLGRIDALTPKWDSSSRLLHRRWCRPQQSRLYWIQVPSEETLSFRNWRGSCRSCELLWPLASLRIARVISTLRKKNAVISTAGLTNFPDSLMISFEMKQNILVSFHRRLVRRVAFDGPVQERSPREREFQSFDRCMVDVSFDLRVLNPIYFSENRHRERYSFSSAARIRRIHQFIGFLGGRHVETTRGTD